MNFVKVNPLDSFVKKWPSSNFRQALSVWSKKCSQACNFNNVAILMIIHGLYHKINSNFLPLDVLLKEGQ